MALHGPCIQSKYLHLLNLVDVNKSLGLMLANDAWQQLKMSLDMQGGKKTHTRLNLQLLSRQLQTGQTETTIVPALCCLGFGVSKFGAPISCLKYVPTRTRQGFFYSFLLENNGSGRN